MNYIKKLLFGDRSVAVHQEASHKAVEGVAVPSDLEAIEKMTMNLLNQHPDNQVSFERTRRLASDKAANLKGDTSGLDAGIRSGKADEEIIKLSVTKRDRSPETKR